MNIHNCHTTLTCHIFGTAACASSCKALLLQTNSTLLVETVIATKITKQMTQYTMVVSYNKVVVARTFQKRTHYPLSCLTQ